MHSFLPSAYKRKHTQILVDTADLHKKNEARTACQRLTWLSARQKTRNRTEQNVRWLLYQLILRLCDIFRPFLLFFPFLSLSLSQMGVFGKGRERVRGGSVCLRVWRHRRFSSNVMCVPRDVWWINAEQLHCDVPPDLTPTVCLYKTCLTADLS